MTEPSSSTAFETVIGLEIHLQLRTDQKLFCPDATRFGGEPNTNVCPVCLGLPGALPILNREAVDLAVKTAVAFECTVHETSVFARKNYFYPDLPKGYQISQFDRPLATNGLFRVETDEGEHPIRIRRIHIEEDAGKSVHDRFPDATAVDLNRTGTPLIELVSEPDLRSPEQTRAYLQQVKRLLEYLDVSDCNMEEGSLRVDANVSIRARGSAELGVKTELKNLNSFSGVERALRVELDRQRGLVSDGRRVESMTLLWDERQGTVRPMRSKEESHDYRYFPEPDLPPLHLSRPRIDEIRDTLPELPAARRRRFEREYGLPAYDADVLTATRELADYFEEVARGADDPKEASNWVMGPVLAAVKGAEGEGAIPIGAGHLVELIRLVRDGTVNRRVAKELLGRIIETGRSPAELVEAEGLAQVQDTERLEEWVSQVIESHPEEVERFRAGERRLQGYLMGEVMKRSRGRADPKEVATLLARFLEG